MANHDDQLAHYGIKGMRWGIRRTEEQLARARGETDSPGKKSSGGIFSKKKTSKKFSKSSIKEKPKKKVSEMDDSELKQVVERLRLENAYRTLTPKQTSLGKKFVEKLLVDPALNAGSKVMSEYMEKVLRDLVGADKKKKK